LNIPFALSSFFPDADAFASCELVANVIATFG
jgi:hypothetical protein